MVQNISESTQYFKHMNRSSVQFFVSDLWRVYAELASTYFKDTNQIIYNIIGYGKAYGLLKQYENRNRRNFQKR